MKFKKTAIRLKNALDNAQLSPQELANRTGVSKSSISQYLNGRNRPSNISAGVMGKELKVSPLWLMGYDVNINQGIVNNVKNNNGILSNNVGSENNTDSNNTSYTINNNYSSAPCTNKEKEVSTLPTKNDNKEYIFQILDYARQMTDEQLKDVVKYVEFLLSR